MKTTYSILLLACALAAAPAFGSGGEETGAAAATHEMAGPKEPQYGGTLTMKFDWASEGPQGNWDAMRVGYVTRVWGAPYMENCSSVTSRCTAPAAPASTISPARCGTPPRSI